MINDEKYRNVFKNIFKNRLKNIDDFFDKNLDLPVDGEKIYENLIASDEELEPENLQYLKFYDLDLNDIEIPKLNLNEMNQKIMKISGMSMRFDSTKNKKPIIKKFKKIKKIDID